MVWTSEAQKRHRVKVMFDGLAERVRRQERPGDENIKVGIGNDATRFTIAESTSGEIYRGWCICVGLGI